MAKHYEPIPAGLRKVGQFQGVQDLCMAVARTGADWANSINPTGEYDVHPAGVPTGWNNELRAGAEVVENGRGAARQRVLQRTVEVIEYE